MKKWFLKQDLSRKDLLSFLNSRGIQPGEIVVISAFKNFAGSGITFYYYAEEE
jgi:hypothetical protein